MKIWNQTYSKGIGSKSLAGSAWCLGLSWCGHCFCLSLLCLPTTGGVANITAGNSLSVGARLTREEPQKMKNAHILLLYFLFWVLRQIGAEITQFATHRKLTLSFEPFLFNSCSSGWNIIIKNNNNILPQKSEKNCNICIFRQLLLFVRKI